MEIIFIGHHGRIMRDTVENLLRIARQLDTEAPKDRRGDDGGAEEREECPGRGPAYLDRSGL